MAFFNEPQQEEVEKNDCIDQRRLALLRSFEARLWEMNVQVRWGDCMLTVADIDNKRATYKGITPQADGYVPPAHACVV